MIDGKFEPLVPRRVEKKSSQTPVDETIDANSSASDDRREEFLLPENPAPPCDPARCARDAREVSIRIASRACAGALREAIAKNPLFVIRFVDDALRAAGSPQQPKVHLNPCDARACAPHVGAEIVADDQIEVGQVLIEVPGGSIGATLTERAAVLARAAAND